MKRKLDQSGRDFYETPHWVVHRLLDKLLPSSGHKGKPITIFDPCVGGGAIPSAIASHWHDVSHIVNGMDIDEDSIASHDDEIFVLGDFLETTIGPCDIIIANPPFSLAREFFEHAAKQDVVGVAMLQRLSFLSSASRRDLMRELEPEVLILPNRPAFSGAKGCDNQEYAWFYFEGEGSDRLSPLTRPGIGMWDILEDTPLSQRKLLSLT